MIGWLILMAGLADLLTFVCAAAVLPISNELNPVARFLYAHMGVMGTAAYKLAGTALVLLLLGVLTDPLLRGIVIAVAIGLPLAGAIANTLSVVITR